MRTRGQEDRLQLSSPNCVDNRSLISLIRKWGNGFTIYLSTSLLKIQQAFYSLGLFVCHHNKVLVIKWFPTCRWESWVDCQHFYSGINEVIVFLDSFYASF